MFACTSRFANLVNESSTGEASAVATPRKQLQPTYVSLFLNLNADAVRNTTTSRYYSNCFGNEKGIMETE
jgi:hypothetical protein